MNKIRHRINIDLVNYHEAWLAIAKESGVKPTSLASAVIKAAIDEHRQQQQNNVEKKKLEAYLQPEGAKNDVRHFSKC